MTTRKLSSSSVRLSKYIWTVTKAKFRNFCAHCTLHGAYYFSGSSRWWMIWAWILILCCSFSLCCFLSHMIWDKFAIDPTLTVVETTHYSTSKIPFPAVTVCDTESIHGPNTDNITKLLVLRGYNHSQVTEFYESFSQVQDKDYSPKQYVKKMHFLLDDLGFPLKRLLKMFRKPCDELLLQCYWRSRPHNCSEMFRSVYTVTGYCCQFDIPYFKKHTSTETNFIAGVQVTEALELIVSGVKVSANGQVRSGRVTLYVFDQKDKITLIDSAILLTPDAYFDVNVYLGAIDSSSYVKALNLEARKCTLDTDTEIGTSFYQACLTRLLMRKVVSICRCLPFEYTAKELDVEDFTKCTWDRLVCIYQAIENVQKNMRDLTSHTACYQKCDYTQYDKEVEFLENQRNLRDTEEIHSRVAVHFSETTCMKYRREVLYTWDQMLANLGGIFGLCLGGSIVSIMEIIWFMMDLLVTVVRAAYLKKKVEPKDIKDQDRNKIFIVNQSITETKKSFKRNQKSCLKKTSAEVKYKFIH